MASMTYVVWRMNSLWHRDNKASTVAIGHILDDNPRANTLAIYVGAIGSTSE